VSVSPPLVCRLDALDAESRRRHASLAADLAGRIREVRELTDGLEVAFHAEAATLRDAMEWMTLERACCPFLDFALNLPSGSEIAWMRLTGPPGTRDLLRSELAMAAGSTPGQAEIGKARSGELQQLLSLLERNRLPLEGVQDHLEAAIVARLGGTVVGSAVLEVYGSEALLRSVAVDADQRGKGLGLRLSEEALALAAHRGVERVFLLTETAMQFFPKLGFHPIYRSEIPKSVQRSAEFRGACPESAVAMEKRITPVRA
jgi:amino-acid N-acetyltransferase